MDTDKGNRWLTLGANVGVLIGLFLLLFELRQNTDQMRAQIAMERANIRVQYLTSWANGGEVARIEAKLFAQVDGFPFALGWSDILTIEEKRRYEFRVIARSIELNNDWFQCIAGLVGQEICQREIRVRMRRNMHRFYEFGFDFQRSRSGYIETMQELALEDGLPAVNDDGTWQHQ